MRRPRCVLATTESSPGPRASRRKRAARLRSKCRTACAWISTTELPLNGRDYIQLATLSTGVVRTSSGTNGNSGGSRTGGQNSFVANGTRGTLNSFILDRIDNNSNDNGGVVQRTNVDAIQEFKLQTNSYSAEFGRSGGAVVNAVIKSGLNSYHGSVFEFFRCARYSLV